MHYAEASIITFYALLLEIESIYLIIIIAHAPSWLT